MWQVSALTSAIRVDSDGGGDSCRPCDQVFRQWQQVQGLTLKILWQVWQMQTLIADANINDLEMKRDGGFISKLAMLTSAIRVKDSRPALAH